MGGHSHFPRLTSKYELIKWKNISLFVWSEEILTFEEVLQDMLADQVGLTSIKCLRGIGFKSLMHHVRLCSRFNPSMMAVTVGSVIIMYVA